MFLFDPQAKYREEKILQEMKRCNDIAEQKRKDEAQAKREAAQKETHFGRYRDAREKLKAEEAAKKSLGIKKNYYCPIPIDPNQGLLSKNESLRKEVQNLTTENNSLKLLLHDIVHRLERLEERSEFREEIHDLQVRYDALSLEREMMPSSSSRAADPAASGLDHGTFQITEEHSDSGVLVSQVNDEASSSWIHASQVNDEVSSSGVLVSQIDDEASSSWIHASQVDDEASNSGVLVSQVDTEDSISLLGALEQSPEY